MEKKEIKRELFEKYNWDEFFTEMIKEDVWKWVEDKIDKAREEGYKKGYIDGQIEKINKPKTVVSEFDKTSYLN